MATVDPSKHVLLQHPLQIFNLPAEIVDTLSIRASVLAPSPPREPTPPPVQEQRDTSSAFACNVCGTGFEDVQEQREHYKSDWHRYNVKLRIASKPTVSEDEFNVIVEELNDSISGSASSDDSDASSSASLTQIMKRQSLSRPASDAEDHRPTPNTPLIWFQSSTVPVTQFGIYNAVFEPGLTQPQYVEAVKEMQDGGEEGRLWTLFATAGGHFAGMVVRVKRPNAVEQEETGKGKKKKQKPKPEEMEVIHHKTFHRYTTRRKQGGSQSLNDEAKGKAKSAGAMLRRYGEQALREDIRALLTEWSDEIDASERIFIRASTSNKRIFWGYEDNVIEKGDPRIRTFPFPTRRPTLSELQRCLQELTRVKISHLTDEALRALDEAYLASLPKPKPAPVQAPTPPPPKPAAPKLTKEEEAERDRWRRLINMARKGRVEPLKAFWEREGPAMGGVDVSIPEWAEDSRGLKSLLQVACSAGQEEVVQWLLEDQHADPTIAVPSGVSVAPRKEEDEDEDDEGRPTTPAVAGTRRAAYDLATTRAVRNVFRRLAYSQPTAWDWLGAARVPSALSPHMEAVKEGKKAVRRKALKDRLQAREKEREAERAKQEAEDRARLAREKEEDARRRANEPALARTGPNKLGGASANGPKDGLAGLTPEMRARIERERRARAAEARLRG
ncbi:hypothetical protein DACRYDRAFT_99219 [Dacryopinax primogenitus]|uniref:VLRF1 domain-containing protein n=1 Tax=Dacryopinax primogenitus (strain DJM 731) TaxID=1858805 RepID=M5GEW0_DACPD|nr:uncharacterized protein DACRYDRAFT_99219 [Dacryopinax primogenitus]EJU03628.1 hypothetical protein DACRYDRAFT_99219 [Dacryopinax primogenitus]